MNVQVTIKIDREAITELAEVFKEIISGTSCGQQSMPGQAGRQTQQQGTGTVPIAQPTPVTPYVPAPQSQMPQASQPVPLAQPTQQNPQAYSAQIAQKTQLPPEAVTGGAAPASGLPTTVVPQEYTQDQMAVAFTGLIDTGRREAVTQILAAFGVQALTQIPKERYPELVLKLREAGANI